MKKPIEPTIKLGTEEIKIGPNAVPKKPGKSEKDFLKALKKAVREGVFPPPPQHSIS